MTAIPLKNKQRLHLRPNVDDAVHLRDIPWGPLATMAAIVAEAETKMAGDIEVEEGATEVGEATATKTIVVVVGATSNPMMEMEMM